MNVSLTPELERYVASKVAEGLYNSQSEVVRHGLRLLFERDQLLDARIAEVKKAVTEGLEEARRGELIGDEQVVSQLQVRTKVPSG